MTNMMNFFKAVPSKRFLIPMINSSRAKHWYPDEEYFEQFKGPVMYPDAITSKWKIPPWSAKKPPKEVKVQNMQINFGPAHPAAHGCLRLICLLDGEVNLKCILPQVV